MHADLISTYRLQLNKRFTLADAAARADYLRRLGVSHLYLSPILAAVPESDHGYDVCDPREVSSDLGGEEALQRLFGTLTGTGQGCVIDVVPNHLSASHHNPWWWDVLRCGETSTHASKFDVNWTPTQPGHGGKIVLPVLGEHLGTVLETQKLTVGRNVAGEWEIQYGEFRFPVNEEGRRVLDAGDADIVEVLGRQFYRLCHYKLDSEEINYRRFFMVQSLAAVRMEDPFVRISTHAKLFDIVASGRVDGLRVDHPDGLRDPGGYLQYLRGELPGVWLLAEKILESSETLPEWKVDGTTGYDFLQLAGGLWVDPSGEKALTELYCDFTGHLEPYGVQVRNKKRKIVREGFRGEVARLARYLREVCDERLLDFPFSVLEEFITELVVHFPVYRTYVIPGQAPSASDRRYIGEALSAMRRHPSDFDPELLDVIGDLLYGDHPASCSPRHAAAEFVARFQQLTSPVMAKGVEDTALYCYDRLVSLNEVGGDPTRFGITPEVFHAENTKAQSRWPLRMLTTSTHDTKRSEDVRARIAVLSEIGPEWASHLKQWADHNLPAWQGHLPDRNAEYLVYQTLIGTWPISEERVQDYMLKACREASRHTAWSAPDREYEKTIRHFISTVLADPGFVQKLEAFVAAVIDAGRINSLAQTLLKLTCPGIPDIFQGCEIWDNSLVDPDNRRPVDFELRTRLLETLETRPPVGAIMGQMEQGLPKLHVIHQALALRRRHPASFGPGPDGSYNPLLVSGPRLGNVVAFRRGEDIAVVVPRLIGRGTFNWEDTRVELGDGLWRDVMSGSTCSTTATIADILGDFPVALFEKIQ